MPIVDLHMDPYTSRRPACMGMDMFAATTMLSRRQQNVTPRVKQCENPNAIRCHARVLCQSGVGGQNKQKKKNNPQERKYLYTDDWRGSFCRVCVSCFSTRHE